MASSVTITIDKNLFLQIADKSREIASQVVRKTLLDIEAEAKTNIRRWDLIDTGFMLNSVQAQFDSPTEGLVIVGAHYGIYHELGTIHLPARPFLIPAVEAVRVDFEQAIRSILEGFTDA